MFILMGKIKITIFAHKISISAFMEVAICEKYFQNGIKESEIRSGQKISDVTLTYCCDLNLEEESRDFFSILGRGGGGGAFQIGKMSAANP